MSHIIYKDKCNRYFYGAISDKIIRTIEYASRVCYDATDKMTDVSWKKYIGARVRSGHESVIEHGMLTFIIDFTNATYYSNIDVVYKYITLSNSLLHFSSEYGLNPEAHDQNNLIISISGNLKMWRDFIKFYVKNQSLGEQLPDIIPTLIYLFRYIDIKQWDGIFTEDIPEIRDISNELIKNGANLTSGKSGNTGLVFKGPDVNGINSQKLIDEDLCDLIYADHREAFLEENAGMDPGVTMRLINIDKPHYEFIGLDVPYYISSFIHKHIKDIASVTYMIRMPRIITQQESRHRINSISQRSQRYVDEVEKDADFYVPKEINGDKFYDVKVEEVEYIHESYIMHMTYNEFMQLSLNFYKALREDNINKEDARFVLPGSIYSIMVVTKPFYTLDHYFKERCSDRAQKEIRLPAIALVNYLNNEFSFMRTRF